VEPAWEPRRELGRVRLRQGRLADIYRVHVGTHQVERLTTASTLEVQPNWLPDDRLLFTVVSGHQTSLRWLDPANPAEIHNIPLTGGNPGNPAGVR